jgi:hypothetical protein
MAKYNLNSDWRVFAGDEKDSSPRTYNEAGWRSFELHPLSGTIA